MINCTFLNTIKFTGLVLILGFSTLSASFASSLNKEKLTGPDKSTMVADPEKKLSKTDSLSILQQEKPIKKEPSVQKVHNPSSMSSMSYNILFQVIYRFSFSEIFDSPSSSEIVTD